MKYGDIERKRQGIFRDTHPSITEPARKPTDEKGVRNSHLLALGYENENLMPIIRKGDSALSFFCARGIKWWRNSRSGDNTTLNLPTRNLASSQIACVNFLLPWHNNADIATHILKSFDSSIERAISIQDGGNSSFVEFEWINFPGHECLEGGKGTRGANTTSVDAFMIGETQRGKRRAFLIEWKHIEEYSEKDFKGEGTSGETRRKRYTSRLKDDKSAFIKGLKIDTLLYEPLYQIMRLRLLADKIVNEDKEVDDAEVIIMCPKANVDYLEKVTSPSLRRKASTLPELIPQLLKNPASIKFEFPEQLMRTLRDKHPSGAVSEWSSYLEQRYGW